MAAAAVVLTAGTAALGFAGDKRRVGDVGGRDDDRCAVMDVSESVGRGAGENRGGHQPLALLAVRYLGVAPELVQSGEGERFLIPAVEVGRDLGSLLAGPLVVAIGGHERSALHRGRAERGLLQHRFGAGVYRPSSVAA